jgi:Prolyl oligopeptidase, N-terminal beta-propeller domain
MNTQNFMCLLKMPCFDAVVDAQNALTNGVLERCSSRDKFAALMRQLYDYPKYGTPSRHGDRYTYSYNTGLQVKGARWSRVAHAVCNRCCSAT